MRLRFFFLTLFLSVFLTPSWQSLLATAPTAWEDNPTGNTGALKAQIQTGGSYDAHSGNATRVVNDLSVPGALGMYGLDFTRYWNSVHNDYDNDQADWSLDFGMSGWSHSWHWAANEGHEGPWEVIGTDGDDGRYITSITITFPDGHTTKFKIERCGARPGRICTFPLGGHGPPYSEWERTGVSNFPYGGPGVQDHICDMAEDGSSFRLCRADGGSVSFTGGPGIYQATEIFDPYGFKTKLEYDEHRNLEKVIQDGGKFLQIGWEWHTSVGWVIAQVTTGGSASSQTVTYTYTDSGPFLVLGAVTYPREQWEVQAGIPAPTAVYSYGGCFGASNHGECSTPSRDFPLLKRASDPHFAGPMTVIRYDYWGVGCAPAAIRPDLDFEYVPAQPYAIAAEKSDASIVVSSFQLDCHSGDRWETTGLGGVRRFYFGRAARTATSTYYSMGYNLGKVTDFTTQPLLSPYQYESLPCPQGVPCHRQNFDSNCLPAQIWDARNNMIQQFGTGGDESGQPARINYPAGGYYLTESNSLYDRLNVIGTPTANLDPVRMHNKYNHWLFKKTDENGNETRLTRDERRRVTRIDYADNSYEEYTFNDLNQVLTHRLPSGGVQHYVYDDLHRLEREWNSVDGENAPTVYTYDALGRVIKVLTPRAAAEGATFSEKKEYNGRHQVVKVTYPSTTPGSPDPFITYEYDTFGNRTAVVNELGHRTTYTYDSYRRRTSMTEPLNAPAWDGNGTVASRQWTWIYDREIDGVGMKPASAHTSQEWRVQIEPIFNDACDRRVTTRTFDVNNRITSETTGLIQPCMQPIGAWHPGPDTEVHRFTYDENGQKKTYEDPRGRITDYVYDHRNRLKDVIEPKRADQAERPTTSTEYDFVGNKTKVTSPDNQTQQWPVYNAFGQPLQFIDERGTSTYLHYWHWGPMKKLAQVITQRRKDNGQMENQITEFFPNALGLVWLTRFPDQTTEQSTYQFGQVVVWKTRREQVKEIVYDARGREDRHTWVADAAPGVTRVWDAASRLMSISNSVSTIEYEYDDAGQVKLERNIVTGAGTAQTNYLRYPNGEVAHIQYPNGTLVRRNYTARGQLKDVGWGSGSTSYAYLPDGDVNYQARSNGVTTSYEYDGRGLISSVRHRNDAASHDLARRDYWRDNRDRIVAWKRGTDNALNQMEDGRGNRYGYDAEGQLTAASYRVTDPETDHPGPAVRMDSFDYDEMGNRKGLNHVASRGAWMNILRRDNGLNQYASWDNCIPGPGHWGSGIFYDDNIPEPPPDPSSPPWPWVYPGNGVLMQDGYITAGFNALNQPVGIWSKVYEGTGNWMWFGFDPLGRCVKRWKAPPNDPNPVVTYFYYDGSNLIQEVNAATGDRVYVHGGRVDEIVASQVNGVWYHHHYDAQGNCILQSNGAGGVQVQYDYDAFGFPYFYNASGGKGASQTRFLFTGREWLSDLRLYDYRARLYQPELGRFLQPDPKHFEAGDYNLYRYCHNDPVNRSDPTGLIDLTASTWNRQMWLQSGSFLSANQFDAIRQGLARMQWSMGTVTEGGGPAKGGGGKSTGGGGGDGFPPVNPQAVLQAAEKYKSGIENAVQAYKHVPEGVEFGSEVFETRKGALITTKMHEGNGITSVPGENRMAQTTTVESTNKDLHLVGYLVGYAHYDTRNVRRDVFEAAKFSNIAAAVFVGVYKGRMETVQYVRGEALPKIPGLGYPYQ